MDSRLFFHLEILEISISEKKESKFTVTLGYLASKELLIFPLVFLANLRPPF